MLSWAMDKENVQIIPFFQPIRWDLMLDLIPGTDSSNWHLVSQAGRSNLNMEVQSLCFSKEPSGAQIRIVNHQFARSLVFRSGMEALQQQQASRQVAATSFRFELSAKPCPRPQSDVVELPKQMDYKESSAIGQALYQVLIRPSKSRTISDKERRGSSCSARPVFWADADPTPRLLQLWADVSELPFQMDCVGAREGAHNIS